MATRPATARGRVASISSISVGTNKSLKSIDLFINSQPIAVEWERGSEQVLQATLNPSLDLVESSDQITLNLHCHRHLGPFSVQRKGQHIDIRASELVIPERGEDEWKNSYGGVNIVIHFSSARASLEVDDQIFRRRGDSIIDKDSKLSSTTQDVTLICPRFRVLVIGRTGVGKSSVINAAFGINDASVSESEAGISDINTEIISGDNEQFVLHDSQGIEPGEENNFEMVRKFIDSRSTMPNIKDKIHAIWLCFGIPRADSRMLETGIERFLKLENQTPIIAVFTKYDLLISRMQRERGESEDIKNEADAIVKRKCIEPLEEEAGRKVPNVTVSTRNGYEDTLSRLIQLTFNLVRDKVAVEASVVTAIAQKVNPGVNIEASIAVGRMKYWKGLASSTSFTNKAMEQCLDVIHGDIVTVWSLNDPYKHLRSKEFKALITNLVDDLSQNNTTLTISSACMSMAGTISGIIGGPAALIVMPIVGCLVFAKWVYDVYQQSHVTLRRLMAYIVDLTLVMQNVFWLVAIYRVPVSIILVKVAYGAYKKSIVMPDVHERIKKHVEGQTVRDRLDRDSALSKVIDLLKEYSISTAEMFGSKEDMGNFDFLAKDGESWDT